MNFDQLSLTYISHLQLWNSFCSVEWNHLVNFGRGKYGERSCEIFFNLDQISFNENVYGRPITDEDRSQQLKALVADLFLFCYERDFMVSLSDDKQAYIIDAFNTTSRYLDDNININNVYFDNMVRKIYPAELQPNIVNTSETESSFLDLYLFISNDNYCFYQN